jgi:[acyl-carrier-protein] S-malonyltransferase
MGAALAEASRTARDVFHEVDEALGQNLFRLMREGPDDELQLTENAQPAIMAHSLAVFRALTKDGGVDLAKTASFVAGHSLGEYSALCAAGSFDLATTAKLLKLRGQAMQQAVPVGQGAMAALLGAGYEQAEKLVLTEWQGCVLQIANDNDPTQVVISGDLSEVEHAVAVAKEYGFRRAVMLPVSAPFHCGLMERAAEAMASALEKNPPIRPAVPLFANINADAVVEPEQIKELLIQQVTGMVRWRESIWNMWGAGVEEFVELGGKVLGPMVRRIVPEAKVTSVVSIEDVEALAKEIA